MRVLVTGSTGFVGFHVVKALKAKGHTVVALVRSADKARQLYEQHGIVLDHLVVGSVSDNKIVRDALHGCEAVVHAAAITPMQAGSEQDLFATNVDGVKNVIGAACEMGINNAVYVSSITAIFNTDARKMSADAPVAQSRHTYGRSKAQAEEYVRSLQAQGKGVKTVYPGGIIGPDDPGRSATLMSLLYRMTQGFRITSGGTQQIDVRDLAAFIVVLLEQNSGKPGRYLTAGHYMVWSEFADLLDNISGATLPRSETAGWKLRLFGQITDIKRLFKPDPSPISAETMRYATQWPEVKNAEEMMALGVTLRPAAETFTDTLRWMGESGLLDKKLLPKLFKQ
ncbi:MAG TPA: NAD-dependent epimerase/dehydratase family protein [Pseudomonadales bacterium]|nr:NAD-dependent epimerase/dehydratase family protein [Pseudomonadales bacterium]